MHLMVQPDAATAFLGDQVLRDQGLLSRVLVAAPDSLAGRRLYQEPKPEDDHAIHQYAVAILRLFDVALSYEGEHFNELSPRPLTLSTQARHMWIEFHNKVEAETNPNGSLGDLRDVAGKSAEQAARIAGVLAIVENPTTDEIQAHTMKDALELVTWHLNEALRLAKRARISPKLRNAQLLLEWLQRTGKKVIPFREALQRGPWGLRNKDDMSAAFEVLRDHGWVNPDPGGRGRWLFASGVER
jgi:hypothetical protein